jgi:RNA polymerase sigma factor (TIGR02999 family)
LDSMASSTPRRDGLPKVGSNRKIAVELPYSGSPLVSDTPTRESVTQLLIEWQEGDPNVIDRLMPLVYAELRTIAARYLARESPGHTLQSTALVHEAYLRLIDQRRVRWQNRAHFFGIAAQMMRRIMVDHARRAHRDKRGGTTPTLSLDAAIAISEPPADLDLIALDDALTALAVIDPRGARIVELRFFSGLTIEETAEVLGVSAGTIKREWSTARAWLYRELNRKP